MRGPSPTGTSSRSRPATSTSSRWGFQVDGSPAAASQMFRNGVKIYPLDRRDDPPAMEFINKSSETFNTIHANNIEFYDEIHTVIDREPVEILDPETRGLLAAIGIRTGQPFEPDERLRKILVDAVAVGNATARALFFSCPRARTTSTRAASGSAGSSAATTSSCSTAVGTSATSTPARAFSTWPRSTPPPWPPR